MKISNDTSLALRMTNDGLAIVLAVSQSETAFDRGWVSQPGLRRITEVFEANAITLFSISPWILSHTTKRGWPYGQPLV